MGRSIASRGEPKVSKGRAESPLVRPQAQTPAPVGIDAPTPARVDGAAAPTGDSTFFRRERKYQRKHAARRLREKALYCPFWRRGSLCRAQRSWPAYACYRARSELAFFRHQNGRAFFPPLPIAALLPRSWRGAYLPLAGWDASVQLGNFAALMNGLIPIFHVGGGQAYPVRVGMLRCSLGILQGKRSARSQIHAGLVKRAMRPVAEWRSVLAKRQGAASDPRAARPVAKRR